MVNKYELTTEVMTVEGKPTYRIKALKDFDDVLAGDLGGFVCGEWNLSQLDNSWIYDNCIVTDEALVKGNAKIRGAVRMYKRAEVDGDLVLNGDYEMVGTFCASGGTATLTPVTIKNSGRDVIITDNHISCGCYSNTIAYWETLTEAQGKQIAIDTSFDPIKAWDWWQAFGAGIIAIAKAHQAKVAK